MAPAKLPRKWPHGAGRGAVRSLLRIVSIPRVTTGVLTGERASAGARAAAKYWRNLVTLVTLIWTSQPVGCARGPGRNRGDDEEAVHASQWLESLEKWGSCRPGSERNQ